MPGLPGVVLTPLLVIGASLPSLARPWQKTWEEKHEEKGRRRQKQTKAEARRQKAEARRRQKHEEAEARRRRRERLMSSCALRRRCAARAAH